MRPIPSRSVPLLSALGLALALAACGGERADPADDAVAGDGEVIVPAVPFEPPPPPPTVGGVSLIGIDLGTVVSSGGQVLDAKTQFGSRDRILAALTIAGADPSAPVEGVLQARMVHASGTVVATAEETRSVTGPDVVVFTLASDSAWPTGGYRLEVQLDGRPFGAAEFRVTR